MSSRLRTAVTPRSAVVGAIFLVGVLAGTAGTAGAQDDDTDAAAPERDPKAFEIARGMSAALAGADSFRVTVDMSYDAVQPDGQAIEFGAERRIALRRPDHARLDAVDRGGAKRTMTYDGKQIALADTTDGLYATTAHEGDFESMLAHLYEEFGIPTPLGEFLSRNLLEYLEASESVLYVDEQTLDGVACDHLAFRNETNGLQIWVPTSGEPLPRRIVITYEQAPGRPQFRASLRDWQLGAKLDDSLFAFEPDPDAERIYFNTGDGIVPAAARPNFEKE